MLNTDTSIKTVGSALRTRPRLPRPMTDNTGPEGEISKFDAVFSVCQFASKGTTCETCSFLPKQCQLPATTKKEPWRRSKYLSRCAGTETPTLPPPISSEPSLWGRVRKASCKGLHPYPVILITVPNCTLYSGRACHGAAQLRLFHHVSARSLFNEHNTAESKQITSLL